MKRFCGIIQVGLLRGFALMGGHGFRGSFIFPCRPTNQKRPPLKKSRAEAVPTQKKESTHHNKNGTRANREEPTPRPKPQTTSPMISPNHKRNQKGTTTPKINKKRTPPDPTPQPSVSPGFPTFPPPSRLCSPRSDPGRGRPRERPGGGLTRACARIARRASDFK